MKEKYNLALLPMTKSEDIINASQAFSNMADKYVLGEQSLPHLTLYQFKIEESETKHLWEVVCETWNEDPINLVLEKLSFITFDEDIYWVSLLPGNPTILRKMHEKISRIINHPAKESFDPHVTLINTRNKDCKKEVDKFAIQYEPIRDSFILKLGKRDDVGQFTEVV
jgi:2'-5' RNA ligase